MCRIVDAMSYTEASNPIKRKQCLIPGPMAKNEPGTSSPSAKSCLAITGVVFS